MGADLLAAVASAALVSAVALAFVAADVSLAGEIPLWDAALVVSVLALLASVLAFPEWWAWAGGWSASHCGCPGARKRRASQTVNPRQARSASTRRRLTGYGVHRMQRSATSGLLAGHTWRSPAERQLAARRGESMARLQRQHGRPRG